MKLPFEDMNGITIRGLKEIVKDLPEVDENNHLYEVWVTTGKNTTTPVKEICKLNSREEGSDLLLDSKIFD